MSYLIRKIASVTLCSIVILNVSEVRAENNGIRLMYGTLAEEQLKNDIIELKKRGVETDHGPFKNALDKETNLKWCPTILSDIEKWEGIQIVEPIISAKDPNEFHGNVDLYDNIARCRGNKLALFGPFQEQYGDRYYKPTGTIYYFYENFLNSKSNNSLVGLYSTDWEGVGSALNILLPSCKVEVLGNNPFSPIEGDDLDKGARDYIVRYHGEILMLTVVVSPDERINRVNKDPSQLGVIGYYSDLKRNSFRCLFTKKEPR